VVRLALLQVLFPDSLRFRDERLVETISARLVASDQERRLALRVERVEHSKLLSTRLDSKLPERVARPLDRAAIRERKRHTRYLQHVDEPRHVVLVALVERVEPFSELVRSGNLDHRAIMRRGNIPVKHTRGP